MKNWFVRLILGIFGNFLLLPGFLIADGGFDGGMLTLTTSGTICRTTVQCQHIRESEYRCTTESSSISEGGYSTMTVPVAKSGNNDAAISYSFLRGERSGFSTEEDFSDTRVMGFRFPFVRIIKIQV